MTYNYSDISTGWRCPVCNTVMAPWQPVCVNCNTKQTPQITCKDNITIGVDKLPNTITWTPNPKITVTSNQDTLRTTLKSAGIDI